MKSLLSTLNLRRAVLFLTISAVLLLAAIASIPSTHPAATSIRSSTAPSQRATDLHRCFFGHRDSCHFDYEWDQARTLGTSPLVRPRVRTAKGWRLLKPGKDEESEFDMDRKINVLYFNERTEYLEKMDRYYYDEVKAASLHPNLNTRLWGPGWPSYNPSLTPTQNILDAFPTTPFDVIYTKTWHHNITSPTAVVIHGTGDCHSHKCVRDEYFPTFADAVTFRYAGLVLEFGRVEQWDKREAERVRKLETPVGMSEEERNARKQPMPFFFHSPDCADEEVMHPIHAHGGVVTGQEKWEDSRPNLIRLIGNTKKGLYPLRAKVKDAIKAGKIQDAKVYEHVGYVLDAGKKLAGPQWGGGEVGLFDAMDPDVAHHRKNQKAWSKVLATTQICVFDASIVKKAIRKFQESFLSGCVVASDVPYEMQDVFKDVMIPLSVDMTVDEINDTLQTYLQDKERLRWMAMEAFRRARAQWTCRNKVDRLLEAAEMVASGQRGYWMPFGFLAGCRRFGEGEEYVTEWCRGM
ncbi:hypothetical protein HDU98_006052 [Podochytrium sp. JEL0797]|nr:hypothetical protein HDU98_006052 [Podochytrium sp. JEL0797]